MKNQEKNIKDFIKKTFQKNEISSAVIAVSGGLDSAVSLTLATKSLSPSKIFPVLLPYDNQDMQDAVAICFWNNIPEKNITTINIKSMVDEMCLSLKISEADAIRRGNIMARVRMIAVFDIAKKRKALVVGTENKSEHYLGYFTRFGDEASDIEPIVHLYKTEVISLAQHLGIPSRFISKPPSAELWEEQTDEKELGFSYQEADVVLREIVDEKKSIEQVTKMSFEGISNHVKNQVIKRYESQGFKRLVPYGV